MILMTSLLSNAMSGKRAEDEPETIVQLIISDSLYLAQHLLGKAERFGANKVTFFNRKTQKERRNLQKIVREIMKKLT